MGDDLSLEHEAEIILSCLYQFYGSNFWDPQRGLSIETLCDKTGYSVATIHAALKTLEDSGYAAPVEAKVTPRHVSVRQLAYNITAEGVEYIDAKEEKTGT